MFFIFLVRALCRGLSATDFLVLWFIVHMCVCPVCLGQMFVYVNIFSASLEPCQCVFWFSSSQQFGFGGCCSVLYLLYSPFPSLSTVLVAVTL